MIKTVFTKADKPRIRAWLDSAMDSLKDGVQYVVQVKESRRKRSLSANGYAWALIDKLADFHNLPKEDVYAELCKDLSCNSFYMSVEYKDEKRFVKDWSSRGIGWYAVKLGNNLTTAEYRLTYGSSMFDTKQMSQLIDLIVQECKQAGIETMPPKELESLIKAWKEHENESKRIDYSIADM